MSKPQPHRFVAKLGNDELIFETGVLAGQAGGAVTLRSGDCFLLTTATASNSAREGIDFFPLSVEFEEKLYAAGRIPGSFFRREGKPGEDAILTARLTDRPLRPLFNKNSRNEVQIIITPMSSDGEKHLDILAINSASTALMISDIPWDGPVGAVRIGLKDGQLLVNPSISEMEGSLLDLRVAGTEDAILMVEAGANEIPEDKMIEALRLAHESIQDVIRVQKEMQAQVGKPKRELAISTPPEETVQKVMAFLEGKIEAALQVEGNKQTREAAMDAVRDELVAHLETDETVNLKDVHAVYSSALKKAVRSRILKQGIRPDGRGLKDVRPIWGDVAILPRAHGSGLFTRGETQVLTVTTMGTPRDEQRLDTLGPKEIKRYLHHYNFPPFSTGETGRVGSPGRREIGHGALAERALIAVLPDFDQFPYTLRLVSEVLSSNGSTSMASVCGSTLSLMDAGVPIKAPVAGAAMGLVEEGDEFAILTDIQGLEDALGDMDFKVAGTRQGITALQMDIKISGLRWDVMEQALTQAREARFHILDKMHEIIAEPRGRFSPYAPSITTVQIDPEKIGKVIGPGGKMIRAIQEETGAKIDIDDDGTVYIAAANQEASAQAQARIEAITEEAEIGKIYTGKVVRIADFGAFVEILPDVDGLVPISQLADYRVPSVEDVVQLGDEIMVMVTNIDSAGKIRLSRQAVLEGWTVEEARERDRRPGDRPGGGGGDRRGGGSGDRRGGGGFDRRGGGDRDRRGGGGGDRRGGGDRDRRGDRR
ncbi:MAG: polyribonucleotide nucleotidyltransferase [Anaerolineae bacterium]|nr:polyribonucleotide nucleotidyltransferase [Anaerolineae bacterium]